MFVQPKIQFAKVEQKQKKTNRFDIFIDGKNH